MRAEAMRLANLVELWGKPIEAAPADPAASFSRIGTDSRELEPGCLFVPLVGERFDGHRFLEAALEQGALAALAQRDRLSAEQAEALVGARGGRIWLVDDTQAAYQELGRLWRRQGSAPVIAVTGSAGKTTTRELIRAVLAPSVRCSRVWATKTTTSACRSPCSRPAGSIGPWWWRWACAVWGRSSG